MNTKLKVVEDFDFGFICDFYKLINRQGPGSEATTRKALSFIEGLPAHAQIADIGCGTGGQTLTLARNTSGTITAVDLSPDFINRINIEGVHGIVASMDNLPFGSEEFDLIWSEGAIYNIGFAEGLRNWKQYLKSDGYIAVSEVSWLTKERPKEIEEFWKYNYPGIDSISNKVEQMCKAGYTPVAHFVIPENCWTENFYDLMPQVIETFLKDKGNSMEAQQFVESQKAEIDLYNKYKDYYGYVFYIGKKQKTMAYNIRKEAEKDYTEIYNLIETAFKTARVKDGTEQDFAVNLRNSPYYVNELALVAETNDIIIGHIMSTETYVTLPDGEKFPALMIAPLTVALEYRDHGIGGALLKRSFEIAREMGYKAMFLCGDPNYYSRHGFRPIGDFDITHNSIPEPYVMGLELVPNALKDITGVVRVE